MGKACDASREPIILADFHFYLFSVPENLSAIGPGIPSKGFSMKKDIHPTYRDVVFQDLSSDFSFLTRSTIQTKDTITWEDGKEYPLVKVEVSSRSHPFYTGKQNIVDTAGRVDRFRRKYRLS